MTVLRPPVLAGVTALAGASTLAAALHGSEAGRPAGPGADVLVCRHTADSLCRAAVLAGQFSAGESGPVLAVVPLLPVAAEQSAEPGGSLRNHPTVSRFRHVAWLPYVAAWHQLTGPPPDAAGLLGRLSDQLDGSVHSYAVALRVLVGVLTSSGRLTQPEVPAPALSRATAVPRRRAGLWPGLGPIERCGAPHRPTPGELDDDELEAAQLWRAAG